MLVLGRVAVRERRAHLLVRERERRDRALSVTAAVGLRASLKRGKCVSVCVVTLVLCGNHSYQ